MMLTYNFMERASYAIMPDGCPPAHFICSVNTTNHGRAYGKQN